MKRKGLLLFSLFVFICLCIISGYSRLAKGLDYFPAPSMSTTVVIPSTSEESFGQEQKFSNKYSVDVHTSVYPAYKYIGNRYSRKFHSPDCSYLPEEKNRVYLCSREEALSRGYVPCQKCCP